MAASKGSQTGKHAAATTEVSWFIDLRRRESFQNGRADEDLIAWDAQQHFSPPGEAELQNERGAPGLSKINAHRPKDSIL
jgi:hypothetical protein